MAVSQHGGAGAAGVVVRGENASPGHALLVAMMSAIATDISHLQRSRNHLPVGNHHELSVSASQQRSTPSSARTGKAPRRSMMTVVGAPRLRHLLLPTATRHLPLPLTAVALHVSHTHT